MTDTEEPDDVKFYKPLTSVYGYHVPNKAGSYDIPDTKTFHAYVYHYDHTIETTKEAIEKSQPTSQKYPKASPYGPLFDPNFTNWNEEFQKILEDLYASDTIEDEQFIESQVNIFQNRLSTLCTSFAECATKAAMIIVNEKFLPLEQKTIKPCDVGGIAGGTKYIHQNMLLKFAVDNHGLYGNADLIMKVANQELLSLVSLIECKIAGLHFPLMTLVDYGGHRIIASSLLPIGAATIVYGSADAGMTVHDSHAEVKEKIQQVSKMLNLQPHIFNGVQFYGPVDMEVHLGRDNRLYVIDTSRLFPPTTPIANRQLKRSGQSLAYHFRPLQVLANPTPLSSDAYSGFGNDNKAQYNADIDNATSRLLNQVVPEFVTQLEKENLQLHSISLRSICQKTHVKGINFRYFGLMRKLATSENLKQVLLLIMLARAAMSKLRNDWRQHTEPSSGTTVAKIEDLDTLYQKHAAVYLTHFIRALASGPIRRTLFAKESAKSYSDSNKFWQEDIKDILSLKFQEALTEDELQTGYDLRKSLEDSGAWRDPLLKYFMHITGTRVISLYEKDWNLFLSQSFINPSHLRGLKPKTKLMSLVFRDIGIASAKLAQLKLGSGKSQTIAIYAHETLKNAQELRNNDTEVTMYRAVNYLTLAQLAHLDEKNCKANFIQRAMEQLDKCLALDPNDPEFLFWKGVAYYSKYFTEEQLVSRKPVRAESPLPAMASTKSPPATPRGKPMPAPPAPVPPKDAAKPTASPKKPTGKTPKEPTTTAPTSAITRRSSVSSKTAVAPTKTVTAPTKPNVLSNSQMDELVAKSFIMNEMLEQEQEQERKEFTEKRSRSTSVTTSKAPAKKTTSVPAPRISPVKPKPKPTTPTGSPVKKPPLPTFSTTTTRSRSSSLQTKPPTSATTKPKTDLKEKPLVEKEKPRPEKSEQKAIQPEFIDSQASNENDSKPIEPAKPITSAAAKISDSKKEDKPKPKQPVATASLSKTSTTKPEPPKEDSRARSRSITKDSKKEAEKVPPPKQPVTRASSKDEKQVKSEPKSEHNLKPKVPAVPTPAPPLQEDKKYEITTSSASTPSTLNVPSIKISIAVDLDAKTQVPLQNNYSKKPKKAPRLSIAATDVDKVGKYLEAEKPAPTPKDDVLQTALEYVLKAVSMPKIRTKALLYAGLIQSRRFLRDYKKDKSKQTFDVATQALSYFEQVEWKDVPNYLKTTVLACKFKVLVSAAKFVVDNQIDGVVPQTYAQQALDMMHQCFKSFEAGDHTVSYASLENRFFEYWKSVRLQILWAEETELDKRFTNLVFAKYFPGGNKEFFIRISHTIVKVINEEMVEVDFSVTLASPLPHVNSLEDIPLLRTVMFIFGSSFDFPMIHLTSAPFSVRQRCSGTFSIGIELQFCGCLCKNVNYLFSQDKVTFQADYCVNLSTGSIKDAKVG